jgi:hypothetical protein
MNQEQENNTKEIAESQPSWRRYLICDGCGRLWEDTEENIFPECECGKLLTRMEWADENDLLAAIHKKAQSALQTSWLYSGREHVEKLLVEIASLSSNGKEKPTS